MRAIEAGWILSSLARGGVVDLPGEQVELLGRLHGAGLVRPSPDPGGDRERLAQLREELARVAGVRAGGDTSEYLAGRERGLRTAIVDLSEQLAESEGAAVVRSLGAGGYRDTAASEASSRWQITQRGRALLSDLSPRLTRAGGGTLESFVEEMGALRAVLAWRATRAATALHELRMPPERARALRSAAIGLSSVRAEPVRAARAFWAAYEVLRRVPDSPFFAEQDIAFAESLCLLDPSAAEQDDRVREMHALRADLLHRYARGVTEDALDAAALLAPLSAEQRQARIDVAAGLAVWLRERGLPINLSLALMATAGDDVLPEHLVPTIASLDQSLSRDVADPVERMTVAAMLSFSRGDAHVALDRWRTLRQYLARFAPEGMAVAAAMLSWIALEPAELLDDVRLAAAELGKHRLVQGGSETMTLAIKLLLGMAALAQGNEGDREERLALGPVAAARLSHLGMHGTFSALPLAAAVVTAFHRTVLEAAAEWERSFQPTHSSYVFGGSGYRRTGWG